MLTQHGKSLLQVFIKLKYLCLILQQSTYTGKIVTSHKQKNTKQQKLLCTDKRALSQTGCRKANVFLEEIQTSKGHFDDRY